MSFSIQTNLSQQAEPNIIPLEGYNIRALFNVLRSSKCEHNIVLQNGEVLSSDNPDFINKIITDTAICIDRPLPFVIMTIPKLSCKADPLVKAASNEVWGCCNNEFISTFSMCEQYAKGAIYLSEDGKAFTNSDIELKIPYLTINNFASKLPSGAFHVFANDSFIGMGNRNHSALAYRCHMLYEYLKNPSYINKHIYSNLQEDSAFINAISTIASLGTTFYLIGGKWPIHLFKNFIPYSKGDKVDFVIYYKEGSSRLLLEAIIYKKGTGTIHQFSNHLSPMTYEVNR